MPVIARDSVRDQPRQQRHAGVVEGVRGAVGEERMDARPGREDLERADVARGRVAAARGGDVAPHLGDDADANPACQKPSGPAAAAGLTERRTESRRTARRSPAGS